MAKSLQFLTAWLDCAAVRRQLHLRLLDNPLDMALSDQWEAAAEEDLMLFDACLANGWTLAELDAAYARRFGVKVNR